MSLLGGRAGAEKGSKLQQSSLGFRVSYTSCKTKPASRIVGNEHSDNTLCFPAEVGHRHARTHQHDGDSAACTQRVTQSYALEPLLLLRLGAGELPPALKVSWMSHKFPIGPQFYTCVFISWCTFGPLGNVGTKSQVTAFRGGPVYFMRETEKSW